MVYEAAARCGACPGAVFAVVVPALFALVGEPVAAGQPCRARALVCGSVRCVSLIHLRVKV